MLETGQASIDQVAADMGMSRQTLYRRLRQEGVTFEALLDKLRHRLALRYLREDKLSVKAASYRLGFSIRRLFARVQALDGCDPRARRWLKSERPAPAGMRTTESFALRPTA